MESVERMNVVTALNKKYLLYTGVMLTSLCINNKRPIRAFLLHNELDEEDVRCLKESLAAFDAEIVPIKVQAELFDERLPRNMQWSVETYYRLLMLDILPEDVTRLLYIDVDIIINKSLEEIYKMDFGEDEYEIFAADDACGEKTLEKFGVKQQQMFEPMLREGYRYFNAGFMLMNIEKMRKKYNFQTYVNAIEEWEYQMEAPDQDILNYVHWKKVGYIDYRDYDFFARIAHNRGMTYEEVKENVTVIHYAGEKPWETKNCHFDIEQLWWDYAEKTPFYVELLREFLYQTMFDETLENYVRYFIDECADAKKNLKQSVEINQKLLSMLGLRE